MIPFDAKVALMLGHPGHELRIFRFLEIYKPRVYVLTDGSGAGGNSRVHNTMRIIQQTGATASPVMGRFTDTEIYRILEQQDTGVLAALMEEIMDDMKIHQADTVAGDAVEGFNPTHDLCRYMINAMTEMYGEDTGRSISNYEFLLDGPPAQCPVEFTHEAVWIRLTEEDFLRKLSAARDYPELHEEIEKIYAVHGAKPFLTECLWPSPNRGKYKTWTTEEPYYEAWGREKLKSGVYKTLISYHDHLLPIAEFLTNYSKTHAGTHNEYLAC